MKFTEMNVMQSCKTALNVPLLYVLEHSPMIRLSVKIFFFQHFHLAYVNYELSFHYLLHVIK